MFDALSDRYFAPVITASGRLGHGGVQAPLRSALKYGGRVAADRDFSQRAGEMTGPNWLLRIRKKRANMIFVYMILV